MKHLPHFLLFAIGWPWFVWGIWMEQGETEKAKRIVKETDKEKRKQLGLSPRL